MVASVHPDVILIAAPEVNSCAAMKRGAPAPRTPGRDTPGALTLCLEQAQQVLLDAGADGLVLTRRPK